MVLSFLKSHHQTKVFSLNHLVCAVYIFAKLSMTCGKIFYYIVLLLLAGFLFFLPLMPYSFWFVFVVKAGMTVVKAVGLVDEVLLSVVVPLQLKCYSSFQHYLT